LQRVVGRLRMALSRGGGGCRPFVQLLILLYNQLNLAVSTSDSHPRGLNRKYEELLAAIKRIGDTLSAIF
jgi:hypothetical protein